MSSLLRLSAKCFGFIDQQLLVLSRCSQPCFQTPVFSKKALVSPLYSAPNDKVSDLLMNIVKHLAAKRSDIG